MSRVESVDYPFTCWRSQLGPSWLATWSAKRKALVAPASELRGYEKLLMSLWKEWAAFREIVLQTLSTLGPGLARWRHESLNALEPAISSGLQKRHGS
jgi:hypothetical protein